MSYSQNIKDMLAKLPTTRVCCKKALMIGLLTARGHLKDGETMLTLSHGPTLLLAEKWIGEQFGRTARRVRNPFGAATYSLVFSSESAQKILLALEYTSPEEIQTKSCPDCSRALLRGIFLAAGRVSDPEKQYHLEFSCGDRRHVISSYLERLSYPPKSSDRRKEKLLYYKDNTVIGEILAQIGAAQASYDFINAMIERQYRGEASRRANCETRNIARAVEASLRQLEVIQALSDAGLLSSLPPHLANTAKYRLLYRDLSLSQLAAIMIPPLTKSGLNHRLEKITVLAEEMLSLAKAGK